MAELEPYGFSQKADSDRVIQLTNRFQRVSVNSTFSTWEGKLTGDPEGTIVEPLFFNIFLDVF